MMVPVSVKKSLLWIRKQVGKSAFKTPNQGLDCSFCCWIAWPRLAQKECSLKDAGTNCVASHCPCRCRSAAPILYYIILCYIVLYHIISYSSSIVYQYRSNIYIYTYLYLYGSRLVLYCIEVYYSVLMNIYIYIYIYICTCATVSAGGRPTSSVNVGATCGTSERRRRRLRGGGGYW